ncbi:vesicular glutamate transporter 1 isoform X2 [Helicoverpa zea]|uniref:vesicular glutamate transporter 1 isoform X2 n=1 Tax=Helicoverpa zea TaxID=7113 RepID=UPI000B3A8E2C|nr:vesicular glutamate transporter 1 isoform X2 [Helicoverpa zea]XP_049703209.1 vesicular glutamate transporter 1 isoform X2 [Helicoverpa armigera]
MANKQDYDYTYTPLWTGNEEQSKDHQMSWCFWRRRRLVVAILAFFGFFNVYALRVNLSVAVVAMTEPVETKLENGTIVYIPEFDWSSQTKGLVLSSFFYGYLITQLPGGWLAAKIGGNRVFAIGIGATSLLTLFTPPLAHTSTALLIAVRVVEGLFEGVTYPCIHAVWSRWAPSSERARLATFAFSGSYAGTVVSMPICSLLAHYTGWPGIFYVFGLSGLIWTTIWWLVVKESPEKDPHISPAELKYIQDSRGTQAVEGSKIRHPWKAMLTSGPVWAIVMAHFSENWGFYTLLTFLPTFMQDVFKFETSQTGFLSAVPYLAMAIVLQVAGHAADWLLRRGIMSRTNIRKLFNCGAFLSQTVFMVAAAYSTTVTGCIVFLTIAVGLGGFAWSGFSVNHLDIAPPHASVLMGLSNTIATLPGIISPPLAGSIVTDKTADQWRIVFFISSAIYLLGAAVYGVLCSAELQPWVLELDTDASFDTDADTLSTPAGLDNKGLEYQNDM